MKVAVIGAGASGILYAILRKKQFPQDEVILVDKEDRLGKKIYVTGNGRCNLFHEQTAQFLDAYSNYKEAEGAFKRVPLSTLKEVFSSLGLDTIKQGELYYPRTLSAKTVMDVFNFWIKKLNIQIWTKKELKQYMKDLCLLEYAPENETEQAVLLTEWENFAKVLLASCTGSKTYCSTLFGIVPIKDASVARKIAEEIDFVTRTYPQKLELADEFAPFREVMVNTYCNMIENGSSYWYEVVNS